MERVFGNYTLVERLGIGGMGEVHRAVKGGPDGFEVVVALKLILPHLAKDKAFRERFTREAKLAASLAHPNIVRVHGYDFQDDIPYIEMEYVAGADLAALIRSLKEGEPPPLAETAHIIHGVAKGLANAHSQSVIHRDLNPHNILLSTAGEVKIADFGIARASLADATVTATLMGKLSYMAPEQVDGKPLDHRCDLFSLGITAYQLLTGIHPFKRASEAATLIAVQKASFRPLAEFVPELPGEIRAMVESLLSADPNDRPENAEEVADVMENQVEPGASAALAQRVEKASSPVQFSNTADSTALGTALTVQKFNKKRTTSLVLAVAGTAGLLISILFAIFYSQNRAQLSETERSSLPVVLSAPPTSEPSPMRPSTSVIDQRANFRIRVDSVPPRAQIYREGVLVGTTPLGVTLAPEESVVELQARLSGYSPALFAVSRDTPGGQYITELAPVVMGNVTISIRPWGTISAGGKVVGENHREFELPVGRHQLILANSALGMERIVTVDVVEGENRFVFDMEK
jgi:serine/threonine protein kinase